MPLPVFTLNAGPTRKPRVAPLGSYVPNAPCPELLWKNRTYDPALKMPDDAFTKQLKQSGIDFETSETGVMLAHSDTYTVECLASTSETAVAKAARAALRHRIVVIVSDDSRYGLYLNETVTHYLLQARAAGRSSCEIVWNGALRPWRQDGDSHIWGQRSGKPDVLVWHDNAWVPVDIKYHKVLNGSTKTGMWTMSPMWEPNSQYRGEATGAFNHHDALQLCHYVRMMEFHSIPTAPVGGIIGKPDNGIAEHTIVWLNLDELVYERGTRSALEDYDDGFNAALAVAKEAAKGPRGQRLTRVEWKSECSSCPWRKVCLEEAVAADELTLLPGMTVSAARTLHENGITTVAQLAYLDHGTAQIVEEGAVALRDAVARAKASKRRGHLAASHVCDDAKTVDTLARHGVDTVAQLAALDPATAGLPKGLNGRVKITTAIDQARVFDFSRRRRSDHVFLRRGMTGLVLPNVPVELHVDMEEDGLIYLWGVRTEQRSKKTTTTGYIPFVTFDNTPEAEAQVFAEFWRYLTDTIAAAEAEHGPGKVKVYHYTAAEDRCMKHLARAHAGVDGVPTIDEVEQFVNSDIWYDLYPVLAKDVIWPLYNHTLKSLAKYARFIWRDSDPSGAGSTVWYKNACDLSLSDEEREAWKQRLIDYNEDDVRATSALLAFFRQMLSVYDPRSKLQPVSDLDAFYQRKRRAA
jgi:predicted RecB family nuclease